MPYIATPDGTRLYYEEAGAGTAVVFVHEYAGDYRTWEPQMRTFARSHRCVTFSQRGYPPSDVPTIRARYSQDIARDDVIARDGCARRSTRRTSSAIRWAPTPRCMSASSTPQRCISVVAAGCGWGSLPDPKAAAAMKVAGAPRPARCSPRRASRGRGEIRRRADAPDAQEQGPARLCRIRPHAVGAFGARPRADHVQPAAQAPDAVGDGSRPEALCSRRCWSSSATRTSRASKAACF